MLTHLALCSVWELLPFPSRHKSPWGEWGTQAGTLGVGGAAPGWGSASTSSNPCGSWTHMGGRAGGVLGEH